MMNFRHPIKKVIKNDAATKKFILRLNPYSDVFSLIFLQLLDQKFNDLFKYLAC